MIILDTNVLSEPMRPNPNAGVLRWLDNQRINDLYLTATSLAELMLGVELLPKGKRREGLYSELNELIERLFGGRILPFDERAARASARLIGQASRIGQAISLADGQIAGIANVHGFIVATRDTTPFLAVDLPIVDPWREAV